jgi:uncharacterized protein YkuJ
MDPGIISTAGSLFGHIELICPVKDTFVSNNSIFINKMEYFLQGIATDSNFDAKNMLAIKIYEILSAGTILVEDGGSSFRTTF